MGFEIRKQRKYVKVKEFVNKMKNIYEKVKAVLKKSQEEMKKIDRNKKEAVEYKVKDKVLSSTKDLMQWIKNKETKKLIKKFVESYKIKKIISESVLWQLLITMTNNNTNK